MRKHGSFALIPDGPVFYDEALADDLSWILRLENCTDFDECRQIAGQLKWRALSRKKMPEADQSKKTPGQSHQGQCQIDDRPSEKKIFSLPMSHR